MKPVIFRRSSNASKVLALTSVIVEAYTAVGKFGLMTARKSGLASATSATNLIPKIVAAASELPRPAAQSTKTHKPGKSARPSRTGSWDSPLYSQGFAAASWTNVN